jgi:hypothetical protein
MRPATSPAVHSGSDKRFAPNDVARREAAHHKARIQLVGLTALLTVGVAGTVLFALQHAWITAAAFAVIVVPILIIVLAVRTHRIRSTASR